MFGLRQFAIESRLVLALLCASFCGQQVLAEGLPREKMEAIKRATVLLKPKVQLVINGRVAIVSGSGFFFSKAGDDGYIATNAHVAGPNKTRPPVDVYFNSGLPSEKRLLGAIVAVDEAVDLAIVKVKLNGWDAPPPIPTEKEVDCYETMPVYMFGFPFGEALARSKALPEITISRGNVSSLRRNKYGFLSAVQIDGSINPGNSGGPIISENGDLIGVAVAKVVGTQIGFAIPGAELRDVMAGRVAPGKMEQIEAADGKAKFNATVQLIDPLRRVSKVTLWTIRAGELEKLPEPGKNGHYAKASEKMESHALEIGEGTVFGFARLALDTGTTGGTTYRYQLSFARGEAEEQYTQALELVAKNDLTPTPKTRPKSVDLGLLPPQGKLNPIPMGPKAGDAFTGDSTRVPAREYRPRFAFPKPEAGDGGLIVAGPIEGTNSLRALVLPVSATPQDDNTRQYATATWSADGKSLYVVGGDNVLRRYEMREQAMEVKRLAIDADCRDMAFSKEGLVIALTSAGVLWVVHPETLEVLREIPLNEVRMVAAAPATSVACAIGKTILSVVDLQQGQIVHSIDMNGAGARSTEIFQGVAQSLRMSPDGKSLFVGCYATLARLELVDRDLKLGDSLKGAALHLTLSPDGRWLGRAEGYRFALYDPAQMVEPVVLIDTGAYPAALDVDPVSGRICASNGPEIQFFAPRGGKQLQFPSPATTVRRILASPAGNRFLIWGESAVGILEVEPKR
jgi:S1-C subfamily serine protease